MSVFTTLFSPIGKWKDTNREKAPPTLNAQIQNIDKVEKAKVDGITHISISARTNIIISPTTADELTMRIHGISTTNYELNAYVTQIEDGLRIKAKGSVREKSKTETEAQTSKEKGDLENSSFANITLEVEIPVNSGINKISVKNSDGNIICKTGINVETLEIISRNGNVQTGVIFQNLSISSRSGNVELRSVAKCNLQLEIDSSDGFVSLNIENVKNSYLHYEIDGVCLINPKYEGNYDVCGKVHISKGSFIYS